MSFFWSVEILSLGCISRDLRVFTPLKQTCIGVYFKIFFTTHLIQENKELRCKNISVSQLQFQGGLWGHVCHPLWVIVVVEHPI